MIVEEVLKIQPLDGRVIVKEVREQKVGKIILSTQSQEKSTFAEVIASDSDAVKVGMKVLVDKYAGTTLLDTDSEVYTILQDIDILGILEDE